MNGYIECLNHSIRRLERMTDVDREAFLLKGHDVCLPISEFNESRVLLDQEMIHSEVIRYSLHSTGEVNRIRGNGYVTVKAFHLNDRSVYHNAVDWIVRWLKVMLKDSMDMEELGFTQTDFNRFRLNELEAYRKKWFGKDVIVVQFEGDFHGYTTDSMRDAVIRYVREFLPLERTGSLSPVLRDSVISNV